MATVFRAHDRKHDRMVALKVMHPEIAGTLGPERFQREIRFAARLQHPHILSVFDSGETAGQCWFTMPFVRGESLRDRLRREGRLPVDEALRITREAAQGLAHAHAEGVVHRDIKPENILLTGDGSTLVADFGIARALGEADVAGATQLTQTGSAIGTPFYMAPEQAMGERVIDARADQYALAAVLYEMLIGEPPFTGGTLAALIAARFTTESQSVRAKREEVPANVDVALQKALALKPADRFESITDFARAIAPALTTPVQTSAATVPTVPTVPTATPAPAGGRRRLVAVAGAVGALVVLLAAGAAFMRGRSAAAGEAGPIRIVVLPFENLGDSADAYLADGITDAVRGKLLALPGVEVIARSSSLPYLGTQKTPREIARELEVRYLLTGTVRFDRPAGGERVMRLAPELMEVTASGAAASRWQQVIDQPLSDVFAAETELATQVAGALRVALGGTERAQLAEALTDNTEAYDLFLQVLGEGPRDDPPSLRGQIARLERAVSLDPEFAEAWAHLSRKRSGLYGNSVPTPALARATREAAERAVSIAPGKATGHLALSVYFQSVELDRVRAIQALERAQALAPNDPVVLRAVALQRISDGLFDGATPLLQTALRLDPISPQLWRLQAEALLLTRRYAEAEVSLARSLALDPARLSVLQSLVVTAVERNDLAAARTRIREGYRATGDTLAVDAYLAIYNELGWVLDEAAQRRVLTAPLAAFDGDLATQMHVRAHLHYLLGDQAASRRSANEAVAAYVRQIREAPDDVQLNHLHAVALAFAGRGDEVRSALDAVGRAEEAVPMVSRRSYFAELRARAYLLIGDHQRALDELEVALGLPGYLGPGQLQLDPMWSPLKGEPRFQALLRKGTT